MRIPFLADLEESFAVEFRDKVKPVAGSVLKCDLALGRACHTGIYLGNDEIAEVTYEGGMAKVNIVDPSDFLNGQPDSLVRTGINIYVASDGCGKALGSRRIAERARRFAGLNLGRYDLLGNNCHMFTVRCVTGETPDEPQLTDEDVVAAISAEFGCAVAWEPTNYAPGSWSFEDDDYCHGNEL